MRIDHSTNSPKRFLMLVLFALFGCASSVEKVVPESGQDLRSIYQHYSGAESMARLQQRTRELQLQLRDQNSFDPTAGQSAIAGFPPQPERLVHLFPKLPNPELFMYVRPHAVGATGAPIPAYMTRFSMYEKEHYALPGETIDTLRRNELVDRARAEETAAESALVEMEVRRRTQRTQLTRNRIQGGIKP